MGSKLFVFETRPHEKGGPRGLPIYLLGFPPLAATELVDEIDVILLMRVFKPGRSYYYMCAHDMVLICLFSNQSK